MNLEAVLEGSFNNPQGKALLELANGSFRGVEFNSARINAGLDNDIISLKELICAKGEYSLKASGLVPVDALRAKNERKNPNAAMNVFFIIDKVMLK